MPTSDGRLPTILSTIVGDSHALDFADGTWDLVYSHTVVHFFLDPVSALKEQRRVTKPGGLVIVSGVREMVYSMRFPACPNWDKTAKPDDVSMRCA